MKKSKGFTLIELLAVIVILAIIALIATPIILNIINDSREKSNLRSIEGYGKAVEETIARLMMEDNYTGGNIRCEMTGDITNCYDLNNSDVSMEVTYSGNRIKNGTIVVDTETGNVIVSGSQVGSSSDYYSYTTEDGAKVNKVTPLECFEFDGSSIAAASDYKSNDKCTSDLVIPSSYVDEDGNVETVDDIVIWGFEGLGLTSVILPNTITSINTGAFDNNNLTNIILPSSMSYIDSEAFRSNKLTYIVIDGDYLEYHNQIFDDNYEDGKPITVVNKTGNELEFGRLFFDGSGFKMKSGVIEANAFSSSNCPEDICFGNGYNNPKITIIEG